MVQCKKHSESTAGNGTQRKTVIFTADIFTVFGSNRRVEVRPSRTFGRSLGYRTFIGKSYVILSIRYIPRNFIGFINRIATAIPVEDVA